MTTVTLTDEDMAQVITSLQLQIKGNIQTCLARNDGELDQETMDMVESTGKTLEKFIQARMP